MRTFAHLRLRARVAGTETRPGGIIRLNKGVHVTPEQTDPALDIVIIIQEALRTPGANVVAIARRVLDDVRREERERATEAVKGVSNRLDADVDDGFYSGYKYAVSCAIAAIRALS